MMVPGNSRRWVSTVAAWSLSIFAAATPIAGVADGGPQDALMLGDLDGRMFVGTFAPADGSSGRQDALSFRGGHFWSSVCVPCGFVPAAYWVRKVGDEIHFRGEMVSTKSGKFDYSGVVKGNRLVATVDWRKDRWYWSIQRQFRFEGELSEATVTSSVAAMVQRARKAAVTPEPDVVCPL
jgi:hypothetical protein